MSSERAGFGGHEFIVFYDGRCPICRREIAGLRRKSRDGKLGWQDIRAEGFDAALLGKTEQDLMAEIHGMHADGRLVTGLAVFQTVYALAGLGWLAAILSWPLTEPLFVRLYAGFARHRLRLGGIVGDNSCRDEKCKVSSD